MRPLAPRGFVWKKIGNEFVKNISYAAERIIHRAEAMKLNTVLLLTNDPEVYPEEKRHEGRVAVNTLRGMLHEIVVYASSGPCTETYRIGVKQFISIKRRVR